MVNREYIVRVDNSEASRENAPAKYIRVQAHSPKDAVERVVDKLGILDLSTQEELNRQGLDENGMFRLDGYGTFEVVPE